MNLRQLEMLHAVAEFGGYARAAEHLHVSHSAVHRQIRLLEEEIQERVLVRAGRHVDLTEAGTILTQLASHMHREVSETLLRVRDLTQLVHGRLRLGTGGTILVSFLPRVLSTFHSQFPNVSIQITVGPADDIASDVENGNLDLGIVFPRAHARKGVRPLTKELLYRDEFVLAVGNDHPLATKKSISLADLADIPLISYARTSFLRQTFERLCRHAGLNPLIAMELECEDSIATMVQCNLGVGILSKRRVLKSGLHCLTPREHRILCEVCLFFRKSDYLPRATREFARICRSEARKWPAD